MTNGMTSELVNILLVEDNAADIRLTREALRDGKILNDLFKLRTFANEIE